MSRPCAAAPILLLVLLARFVPALAEEVAVGASDEHVEAALVEAGENRAEPTHGNDAKNRCAGEGGSACGPGSAPSR